MSGLMVTPSDKERSRLGEVMLRAEDLKTYFFRRDGVVRAVDGVDHGQLALEIAVPDEIRWVVGDWKP